MSRSDPRRPTPGADATSPDASATERGADLPGRPDWRTRLRESRYGTLGVLVVTTAAAGGSGPALDGCHADRGEARWDCQVTNQDGAVVAQYDVLTMVAKT